MVTIVIPTKNSAIFLEACLVSIRNQTYRPIEILLVDSHSTDGTLALAKRFKARIYQFEPNIRLGTFEAPHKRNFGVSHARGEYVYYLDADMELQEGVIEDAVALAQRGFAAAIIPEESFGSGIWAKAKNLERQCYLRDDTVEAPRFFRKSTWIAVGGLDAHLGGGGDDWDLYQKLLSGKYKIGRTKHIVLHNEGHLHLSKLLQKRFMYGRDAFKYIIKRPKEGFLSYFPIRRSYFRNWKLFISRPRDAAAFIVMRTTEYAAGFAGILCSFIGL